MATRACETSPVRIGDLVLTNQIVTNTVDFDTCYSIWAGTEFHGMDVSDLLFSGKGGSRSY